MAIPGLSTVGILFGYANATTTSTIPQTFTKLDRVNSADGVTIDYDQIDASALEDTISKYVQGRGDTGGTWNVTFNWTPEVATQLTGMISAYNTAKAADANNVLWIEVYDPKDTANAYFICTQPPAVIPMGDIGQNELRTVEMNFTVVSYYGIGAGVAPTT